MSFLTLVTTLLISQQPAEDSVKNDFSVNVEIRPRLEFKENYRLSSEETFDPTTFISQRNRLNINNLRKNFNLRVSFQEIHLFLKDGVGSQVGSLNFNELYIEPKIGKHFSALIGRQNFQLDNGRMFSAAPWSQQHRSHEGIRLQYVTRSFRTDFAAFFTRNYGSRFEASYSPVASHKYQYLLVHQLKGTHQQLTYTLINSAELFDKTFFNAKRYATGGRLEYNLKGIYTTLSAFYQYGRNQQNQRVRAYYVQPEVSATLKKFTLRVGAELLSGNPDKVKNGYSNSYEIAYGVAWKFMGNMNFYAKFPADVANKGLFNPYLFLFYRLTKKLQLRLDNHLFYSQYALVAQAQKYLGYEIDCSVNYKPTNYIDLNYGLSFYDPKSSTLLLKKIRNTTATPVWSYLMVSFNPTLFSRKK